MSNLDSATNADAARQEQFAMRKNNFYSNLEGIVSIESILGGGYEGASDDNLRKILYTPRIGEDNDISAESDSAQSAYSNIEQLNQDFTDTLSKMYNSKIWTQSQPYIETQGSLKTLSKSIADDISNKAEALPKLISDYNSALGSAKKYAREELLKRAIEKINSQNIEKERNSIVTQDSTEASSYQEHQEGDLYVYYRYEGDYTWESKPASTDANGNTISPEYTTNYYLTEIKIIRIQDYQNLGNYELLENKINKFSEQLGADYITRNVYDESQIQDYSTLLRR